MAKQAPTQEPSGNRTFPRNPNVESQGGGFRGGPKRWTGRGPPPARHIPWPEIFKHHISVVEGHKKMIDMVRKHTVEGTGNYRTIMGMVERTSEMLWTSRQLQRSFVPPPNQRDQVPLGVSSDSMYPGYSPADHEYGKAAEEYGRAVAEAKKRGIEIPKHPDIEYQVGQGKGIKRKSLAQMRDGETSKEQQNGNGSGSGSGEDEGPKKHRKMNGQEMSVEAKVEETSAEKTDASPEDENQFFVIDTNPTPVNLPTHTLSSKQEADTKADEGNKSKKSKKKHSGPLPSRLAKTEDTEDISSKVDAKLKEKEAKRTQKAGKKRKRTSEKSDALAPNNADDTTAAAAAVAGGGDGEKPKTKKRKAKHAETGKDLSGQTSQE